MSLTTQPGQVQEHRNARFDSPGTTIRAQTSNSASGAPLNEFTACLEALERLSTQLSPVVENLSSRDVDIYKGLKSRVLKIADHLSDIGVSTLLPITDDQEAIDDSRTAVATHAEIAPPVYEQKQAVEQTQLREETHAQQVFRLIQEGAYTVQGTGLTRRDVNELTELFRINGHTIRTLSFSHIDSPGPSTMPIKPGQSLRLQDAFAWIKHCSNLNRLTITACHDIHEYEARILGAALKNARHLTMFRLEDSGDLSVFLRPFTYSAEAFENSRNPDVAQLILSSLSNLSELYLNSYSRLQTLLPILAAMTNLKILSLAKILAFKECTLASVFPSLVNLTEFYFSKEIPCIHTFASALKALPNLSVLDFSEKPLDATEAHALSLVFPDLPNLTNLSLNWYDLENPPSPRYSPYGMPSYAAGQALNPQVMQMLHAAIQALASNFAHLKALKVLKLQGIGDFGIQALVPVLPSLINLVTLDIPYNTIKEEASYQKLAKALDPLEHLQTLYLGNTSLEPVFDQAFASLKARGVDVF